MITLSFIIACQTKTPATHQPVSTDSSVGDHHGDTALAPFDGDCEPSNDDFEGLEVIKTAVPTVPQLQWSGLPAELHYIDGRGVQRIIGSHELEGGLGLNRALPIGLRPNQNTTAQLVRKENGAVVACSEPIQLVTDALPAAFPELDVSIQAEVDDGLIITSILSLDSSFIVAFDAEGEVVWVVEEPNQIEEGNHYPVKNIGFDPYRESILFSRWQNTDFCGRDGYLSWMDWAGNTHQRWAVEGLRVGMTQLDQDSVAVLRCENNDTGLEEDILSVVTETGLEDVWRARDTFPDTTTSNEELSWVHSNYIHAVSTDTVLISMEQVQSVGAINLQTRQFDWRLSGKPSDGTYQSAEPLVDRPHSVIPFEDGHLVYNRSSFDNVADGCAHVRYITFDDQEMRAESPWRLDFEPCSPLGFFGDVLKSDSHIIVIWSDKGQINAYSTDGLHDNHLQLNLPLGYAFTFGVYLSWEQIDSFPMMN